MLSSSRNLFACFDRFRAIDWHSPKPEEEVWDVLIWLISQSKISQLETARGSFTVMDNVASEARFNPIRETVRSLGS
jgi:hypothetical protein